MARIRTIKPEFFLNDEIAELPILARLLYIGLWTQADREGRLLDRPKRIKVELFPYDNCDVNKLLDSLYEKGFIVRYTVQELPIIQINSFLRHQIPGRDEPQSQLPSYEGKMKEYIKPPNDTVRNQIYQRDNYECQYCGEDLKNKSRLRCLDHVIPYARGGSNHESNLVTSCKKCNAVKGCRTPEEAGLTLVNPPLTLEESTVNDMSDVVLLPVNGFVSGKGREGKGKEGKGKEGKGKEGGFSPPTIQEVILYFLENGFPEDLAKKAYEYYHVNNWKDSQGNQVNNWKQKMIAVWFKEQNLNSNYNNGTAVKKPLASTIKVTENTKFGSL